MQSCKVPQSPEQLLGTDCKPFVESLQQNEKLWAHIPLLNYTPLHLLRDMSVVRFRGMIQDMADQEIYLERYEVKSSDGQNKRIQEGKYRDCLVLKEGEEVNFDAAENVQGMRRTLFCITLPGMNDWAKEYEEQCNKRNLPEIPVTEDTKPNNKKRQAPNDDENMDVDAVGHGSNFTKAPAQNKRQCINGEDVKEEASGTLVSAEYLNYSPIQDRPCKACMVKVYSDFDSFELHEVVDFVGFLSVNPALDASTMDEDMLGDFENIKEIRAKNPPPSLVPRLLAFAVQHLPHHNPLLDARLMPLAVSQAEIEPINMTSIQKDLRMLLSLCLFNDDLAADYLLSHLISTVYSRGDDDAIGKFALNICNLPKEVLNDYTKKLYEVLELLIPCSHYLPLSLDILNTKPFVPKKDYNTNRLIPGLLQLSPHTHLVLDETQMEAGKLEVDGVKTLKNLAHFMKHQEVNCNFVYYDIGYHVDIPVLTLSEGKSMLPQDITLPLKTDGKSVEHFAETFKAAHHYLQPLRLDQFRRFLTIAKTGKYILNSKNTEMVQTDYVEMRKSKLIQSGDLHTLLVLSRLLAIASGKDMLDRDCWEFAKTMEAQRKQRIEEMP